VGWLKGKVGAAEEERARAVAAAEAAALAREKAIKVCGSVGVSVLSVVCSV
jgi:hypothetical protein